MQVAETPEKEALAESPPELPQAAPGRLPMTVVSLAALGIVGAATANFLPSFSSLPGLDGISFPTFASLDRLSLPKFDRIALPNFSRAAPKSDRVAAVAPPKPAPVLIPDAVLRAGLRDVQTTQQQHSTALETLTQAAEIQQADLKRVSRQLSSLTAQVNALHNSVAPLTTSSIPQSNPRARLIRTSRRVPAAPSAALATPAAPALPKPVGPVSVGGAPLAPNPTGSGV